MVSIARTTQRLLALATLLLGVLTLVPTAAGAQDGCGTHSFGFAGTRLLNDGISDSAGPFSIDLPAGTYDVTLVSHDSHSTQPDPVQPEEQWFVELDGSWTSPLTPDLADDADHATVTFPALKVPAATQITVRHRGVGGVNSIDVMCVGFTPVADAEEPIAEIVPPIDPILPDPPADVVPDEEPPQAEIVPPVGPIVNPPAPAPEEGAPVPAPEEGAPARPPAEQIEIAGPNADLAPPVVPVEPEVLGEIETPAAPELALTGPNDLLWTLTFGGAAMVLLGAALVAREQRLRA